jgi:hypothetical protein
LNGLKVFGQGKEFNGDVGIAVARFRGGASRHSAVTRPI